MKNNQGIFLKVLLNLANEGMQKKMDSAVLRHLPQELADSLLTNPVESSDLAPLFHQKTYAFDHWHYSWISEILASFDISKQRLFSSLLIESQQKGLARILPEAIAPRITSPLLRKFYKSQLYPYLPAFEAMPIEYLPKSSLNGLLHLKKNQLLEVIDRLGLYDLAHEVRRIVAKKTLTDIYKCLNATELQLLRQYLHAKDNVVTPNLHLESWNGEKKYLQQILHRRGLFRLSIALSGQHPDLIWHIAHIMDVGRGKILQKQTQTTKISSLTDAVRLQVENVMNSLSKTGVE